MNKFLLTENNSLPYLMRKESYGIFQYVFAVNMQYEDPPKDCRQSSNCAIKQ